MIRQLLAVLGAEIRMQLRQPLAVALLTVLPMLTVPGALFGGDVYLTSLESAGEERRTVESSKGKAEKVTVALEGDEDGTARRWLDRSWITIVDGEADIVVAKGDGRELLVRHDAEHANSAQRIAAVLRKGARTTTQQLLSDAGVAQAANDMLAIEDVDHGEPDPGGNRVGAVLPPLLLFTILIVSLYTALDVVSGEKERKTGESVLSTAVDRRVLTAGKGIVVAGSGMLAASVGLVTVVALAAVGWLDLPRVLGERGADSLYGPALLGLWVAVVLLAIQLGAACLSLAAWVPDYRTGSMLSAPFMMALLAPGAVAFTPLESSPLLMLVPIVNLLLACRDGLAGTLSLPLAALGLAATVGHAVLAAGLASRWLGREQSLVGTGDARGRRALGRYGPEAFALFVLVLILGWFFGQLAQAVDLEWGVAATQILLIAFPALCTLAYLGLPIPQTLALAPPRTADVGLAVLAGVFAPALGMLVERIQRPLVPQDAVLELLAPLADPDRPLWVALVVFAVLPGICEEIAFRGAIFGLLRRSMGPVARVCVVAVAFGAAHYLVPRFLPITALGVLFGAAASRSGSLWVPILVHMTSNAVAIGLTRGGLEEDPHLLLLVAGSAGAAGCVAAMGRR